MGTTPAFDLAQAKAYRQGFGDASRAVAVVTPPLTLDGIAYDLEEGGLDGTALVWTSDLDGHLGTGDTVPDVDLSPGDHLLTLTAVDGQWLEASDTVTVTVQGTTSEIHIYLPLVQKQS